MLNIIIQYTLNLSGAFTPTPAVIRITSHTKIRKVKCIVESAILASLVTRHFNLGVPGLVTGNKL